MYPTRVQIYIFFRQLPNALSPGINAMADMSELLVEAADQVLDGQQRGADGIAALSRCLIAPVKSTAGGRLHHSSSRAAI